MQLIIHTDGGARGNPGPAAIGVVIEDATKKITEFGKRIGETTNNVAEYTAVIEALKEVNNQKQHIPGEAVHIRCYLDSMLVVNQLNGLFKVKDARLRELLSAVRIVEQEIGGTITYTSIPREQNRRADELVNRALDEIYSP